MAPNRHYTEAQLVEMRAACDNDDPNAHPGGFPEGGLCIASTGSYGSPRGATGTTGVLLTPCCCVLIVVGVVLALLGGGLVLFFVLKDKGDAGTGVAVHEVVPPQAVQAVRQQAARGVPAQDVQVGQRQAVQNHLVQAVPMVPDLPPQISLESLNVKSGFGVTIKALQMLGHREITFLLDDSGSMNSGTRWKELQHFSGLAVDMLKDFRPQRFDIRFLNREDKIEALPQSRSKEFTTLFEAVPAGVTPIVLRLHQYREDRLRNKEKSSGGLLLVVFTDGAPDDYGVSDTYYPHTPDGASAAKEEIWKLVEEFGHCNAHGPGTGFCVNFIVCNENGVDWLNNLDSHYELGSSIEVIDDFNSEREELRAADRRKFNKHTWVARMLIGATDPGLDKMDEHIH